MIPLLHNYLRRRREKKARAAQFMREFRELTHSGRAEEYRTRRAIKAKIERRMQA